VNTSKIFILIVILVAIGAVTFVINYTKQSSPLTQPIKLPVTEEISVPEEGEKLEAVQMVEIEKIKDEIKTEVEGEIIKYQEEFFYSENNFSLILEEEEEFKSQLIEKLEKSLIGVELSNFEINLNQSKKSAILKCNIKGAMYATNQYDMHFLLGVRNLDLWDDFKPHQPPYGKNLTYEGKIDGVPTKIIFEFPYELSHCHEHVWPK
jgi:hypothetical protein